MFRPIWSSSDAFEIAVEIAALPSESTNTMYTLVYDFMCCGEFYGDG
jgi:hypothetical protein